MNERIKELAEQAGLITFKFGEQGGYTTIQAVSDLNNLERFAELVRKDEREACAKLCEQEHDNYLQDEELDRADGAMWCAAAIRGRTE
jgi:hypothetical protein